MMLRTSLVTFAAAAALLACADEDLRPQRVERPQATRVQLTPVPPGVRVPGALPTFYRIEVRDGDTVEVLAARFGVRPDSIRWNNPSLEAGEPSRGMLLAIPLKDGILHELRPMETLAAIAARYGVPMAAIVDEPSNGLSTGSPLPGGGTVLVPGGRPPVP